MKYLKFALYIFVTISFLYLVINLKASINDLSIVIITFFKSLFPYLLSFLIINQLLIKTKLLYLVSSLLEFFLYPIFKINSKEISLILISLLNGFPSSTLYGEIMIKNNDITQKQARRITPLFFVPSYTFIFFLIKSNLETNCFLILTISLYSPIIMNLLLTRNQPSSTYIGKDILKEIQISFNNFNLVKDLKEIFSNTLYSIVNILGTICFYSIITLIIPILFIKGLFEFSIPSTNIVTSTIPSLTKTLLLLIILVFSSISSLTQASIYLDSLNITPLEFIKKRITMLFPSLIIFNLLISAYFL